MYWNRRDCRCVYGMSGKKLELPPAEDTLGGLGRDKRTSPAVFSIYTVYHSKALNPDLDDRRPKSSLGNNHARSPTTFTKLPEALSSTSTTNHFSHLPSASHAPELPLHLSSPRPSPPLGPCRKNVVIPRCDRRIPTRPESPLAAGSRTQRAPRREPGKRADPR